MIFSRHYDIRMGYEYIKFGGKIRNGSHNISQNVCLGSAWTPGVLIRVNILLHFAYVWRYSLEVCPMKISELRSVDFVINRFFK